MKEGSKQQKEMQQRPEERPPVISSMSRNKNQTIRQVGNMPWPGEDLLQRTEATNSWRTPALGETGEKRGLCPHLDFSNLD